MNGEIAGPYGQDPVLKWPMGCAPHQQAKLWMRQEPHEWQKRVWADCMERGARTAVVTPNGSGKTSTVIPVLGLSFMAAFPGAQVVSTAGVERQVREGLWPVLRSCLAKYPDWSINDDLEVTAPKINGIQPSTWKAFATSDPKAAEGFHSRWYADKDGNPVYAPLMVIIDEAKAFQGKNGIEIVKALTKRCSPDIVLMISTPAEDEGPFYDALHTSPEYEGRRHFVTWTDCPHLRTGMMRKEREDEIAEKGEDDPFVMSWIFGKFFRKGDLFVFPKMTEVERAMSGMIGVRRGQQRIALDYSGGGDEQVIGRMIGNNIVSIEAFHESDTIKAADLFIERFKKWQVRPDDIIADEGGMGKPINDYLASKGWDIGNRYLFNAAPRDKLKYVNRGTEDHFALRSLLSHNAVVLPNDPVLKEQMRKRKYLIRSDDSNRLQTEKKEDIRNRGEKSPDRLDVVIMLTSDSGLDYLPTYMDTTKRTGLLCPTPEDVLREMQEERDNSGGSGYWADNF